MICRAPFLLTLAALVLAACTYALGDANPPSRRPAGDFAGPFACSLVAEPRGRGVHLEARLTARDSLNAAYALRVRGAGVSVDQSGELSAAAGETLLLGQAELSQPLSALDATLSVTAAGRTAACPVEER